MVGRKNVQAAPSNENTFRPNLCNEKPTQPLFQGPATFFSIIELEHLEHLSPPLCKSIHSSLLAVLLVWGEDYIADCLLGHLAGRQAGRQANKYKSRCCEQDKIANPGMVLTPFLAVHNSSIGDLVTQSLSQSLLLLTLQSDPRDL